MAVTVTNQATPIGNKLVQDNQANGTAANNTTGAAGTIYYLEVDNTLNASTNVYFKLVDAASATVGTNNPDYTFRIIGGTRRSFIFPLGLVFSTGFTHWCVTGPQVTDSTGPTNDVTVRYVTT